MNNEYVKSKLFDEFKEKFNENILNMTNIREYLYLKKYLYLDSVSDNCCRLLIIELDKNGIYSECLGTHVGNQNIMYAYSNETDKVVSICKDIDNNILVIEDVNLKWDYKLFNIDSIEHLIKLSNDSYDFDLSFVDIFNYCLKNNKLDLFFNKISKNNRKKYIMKYKNVFDLKDLFLYIKKDKMMQKMINDFNFDSKTKKELLTYLL